MTACDTIKLMMDFKPRPGTFLPFLEYRNRDKQGQPKSPSPLTLLEILGRQSQQSLPLFELQTQSGLDPSRYGEALKSLRNAGYIAIAGDPAEQVITLTGDGAKVAQLARPV